MYDTIIIGGGPAGMSAALYAARYGLKTLLIEKLFYGGQTVTAHSIENYPGTGKAVSGADLIGDMAKQLTELNIDTLYETVTDVVLDGEIKTVRCGGKEYQGRTVIIATGQKPKELGIEGEGKLRGMGVSYCATCDGNFYRNRPVAIVGGGDTAVTEALFLSRICSEVHLIHRRDAFRAAKAETDKLYTRENIRIHTNSVITALEHDQALTGVIISEDGSESRLAVDGLFIAIGHKPNTEVFEAQLNFSSGYIVTGEDMNAGIPGVFAAGDVRAKSLRQIITAASDGAVAAHSVTQYLE